MAFKMKGFSGFKSKENIKEIKDDVVKAAPEYIKKKAKTKAVAKASSEAAKRIAKKAFVKGAAKVALKGAARFIPGVGQVMMARDLYKGGKYLYNKLKK